jgi:hypothetical protein
MLVARVVDMARRMIKVTCKDSVKALGGRNESLLTMRFIVVV